MAIGKLRYFLTTQSVHVCTVGWSNWPPSAAEGVVFDSFFCLNQKLQKEGYFFWRTSDSSRKVSLHQNVFFIRFGTDSIPFWKISGTTKKSPKTFDGALKRLSIFHFSRVSKSGAKVTKVWRYTDWGSDRPWDQKSDKKWWGIGQVNDWFLQCYFFWLDWGVKMGVTPYFSKNGEGNFVGHWKGYPFFLDWIGLGVPKMPKTKIWL